MYCRKLNLHFASSGAFAYRNSYFLTENDLGDEVLHLCRDPVEILNEEHVTMLHIRDKASEISRPAKLKTRYFANRTHSIRKNAGKEIAFFRKGVVENDVNRSVALAELTQLRNQIAEISKP